MTNDASNTLLEGAGLDMAAVPPILTTGFDSESEEALSLRYGSTNKRKYEELTFEFTRDPALLHQYHRMYEEEFRTVQNAQRYREVLDEHDRRGHFFIVRQGNFCVGGARLSTKSPRQPHLLPIEIGDFRIEDHFPHLKQKEMTYGQVGRICLLPDFRGGDITRMMFWHIHRKAVAMGWEVIFGTAPIFNARAYRKNCLAIGLKETKIHFNIEVPPYPRCEEIKMYFMSIGVNKALIDSSEVVLEQESPVEESTEA